MMSDRNIVLIDDVGQFPGDLGSSLGVRVRYSDLLFFAGRFGSNDPACHRFIVFKDRPTESPEADIGGKNCWHGV